MEEKIDVNVKLRSEEGVVELDLSELLSRLSPESITDLIETLAWESLIAEELIRSCREDYASKTFNSNIAEIRNSILTDESAPEVIRHWARGLLHDLSHANQDAERYKSAYLKTRQNVKKFLYDNHLDSVMNTDGLIVDPERWEPVMISKSELDDCVQEVLSNDK